MRWQRLEGVRLAGLLQVFLFPALGGLLFGYDIGATSFVLTQLQVSVAFSRTDTDSCVLARGIRAPAVGLNCVL